MAITPKTITLTVNTSTEYDSVAARYFKLGWNAAINEVILQARAARLTEFLAEQVRVISTEKAAFTKAKESN